MCVCECVCVCVSQIYQLYSTYMYSISHKKVKVPYALVWLRYLRGTLEVRLRYARDSLKIR